MKFGVHLTLDFIKTGLIVVVASGLCLATGQATM
jgi:hypothetical protein